MAACGNVKVIFEALPRRQGSLNLGSRIVFDRAGLMYVSIGDRFQMQRAQDLGDFAGKIVRLRDDGSVPPDNPFVGKAGRPAGDLHLGQPQSAGPRAAIPRPAGSGRSSTGPRAATSSTS